MKTFILSTILSLGILFTGSNSNAGGVETIISKAPATAFTTRALLDFAFRLDPLQIIRAAETVDIQDLENTECKEDKINKDNISFVFKPDVKLIEQEAAQVDLTELDSK